MFFLALFLFLPEFEIYSVSVDLSDKLKPSLPGLVAGVEGWRILKSYSAHLPPRLILEITILIFVLQIVQATDLFTNKAALLGSPLMF